MPWVGASNEQTQNETSNLGYLQRFYHFLNCAFIFVPDIDPSWREPRRLPLQHKFQVIKMVENMLVSHVNGHPQLYGLPFDPLSQDHKLKKLET